MTTRTVLVLGAYGEAGAAIVRGLCTTGTFDVLGAGRNREKLSALKRDNEALRTLQLDITDQPALARAIGEAELVINCVGPFISTGAQTARAARAAGAAYFDIASEQEHYRRLRALGAGPGQDRGLILTGVGAYPGLSGILLKSLLSRYPDAESAEMALITGPHAESSAGGAQAVSGVLELAFALSGLRGGRLHRLRPGRRRRFEFPAPFGAREVLTWPQLEVLAAAEDGELGELSTFAALGGERLPSWLLLQALAFLRPTPGSLSLSLVKRSLAARSARTTPAPDDATVNKGALVVSVRCGEETHTALALAHDLPAATAWLPVYAAKRWAEGALPRAGVAVPMDVLDADAVLAALREPRASATFQLMGT